MNFDPSTVLGEEIRVVVFHLTDRCNLACRHCMFGCSPLTGASMDLEVVKCALRDLASSPLCGKLEIGLTGGEVLTYPHWRKIVREARQLGFRVGIITNGTLIRPADLDVLHDPGVRVAVSLDGAEGDHDSLRGPGRFRQTLAALELLAGAGLVFDLHSIVTPRSLDEIESFLEATFDRFGRIPNIAIQNVAQLGRATAELILSNDELDRLFFLCQAWRARWLETSFVHFLLQRDYVRVHPCRAHACHGERCHRRSSGIPAMYNVLPDGTVLPLWSALSRQFTLGNVRETPLVRLLTEYPLSPTHLKFLAFVRSVFEEYIRKPDIPRVFDWSAVVVKASHQPLKPQPTLQMEGAET